MGLAIYDVAIIGGGYWGSGIAYELSKAGKAVVVIDAGFNDCGTKAASGICDPAAYKSKVFAKYLPKRWASNMSKVDESINWLLGIGCYKVREKFWNQFQGREPRDGTECIYAPTYRTVTDIAKPWLIEDRVHRCWIDCGVWQVCLTYDMNMIQAKALVVAAGIHSGVLLNRCDISGVTVGGLYGRGLICTGTPNLELPVSTMIRPYCKHTVRSWGTDGKFKVGDTAEANPKDSNLNSLKKVAELCLKDLVIEEVSSGYRPVMDEFTVEKLGSQKAPLVLATGGHRVGLGLTGLVAKETVEILK